MKYVDMREALRQVREKAPNTADAMARHKAGNAGFTDKAHLKAKGLIPRADGTKKISPKYESQKPYVSSHSGKDGKTVYDILDKDGKTDKSFDNKILAYDYFKKNYAKLKEETCPKCEGEACECPQSETLEVTNADKMINTTAYQNYKAGDEHYHPAEDLEEQKKQLEEEIEFLSDMKDTMIQEKIQQGFAVRFFDPSNGKRFAAAYPNKKDAQDKAAQLKKDGLKDISITQHTLNFKEDSLYEKLGYVVNYTDSKNKKFATAFKMKKDAENKSNRLKKSQMKDISITTHSINYNNQINFRGLDKPLSLHDKGEI